MRPIPVLLALYVFFLSGMAGREMPAKPSREACKRCCKPPTQSSKSKAPQASDLGNPFQTCASCAGFTLFWSNILFFPGVELLTIVFPLYKQAISSPYLDIWVPPKLY